MKKIYPKIVKKGFSLTKSAKIGVAIGTTAMATSVLGGVAYAANTNPSGPPAKGIVSSCSVTGVQDECNAAINYANAHYGGSGKTTILKIEADTEAHGGTTTHEVFDIRLQAPNGSIYVVHVLRNENNDSVWWSNLAENQSTTSSSTSSSTTPSSTPTPTSAPIVGMANTPGGNGYWEVASNGAVYAFGSAKNYGSMAGAHLNAPIVGMAATSNGGGYWLVGSDGGIFAFGNAKFYGSMGGSHLNKPVVGIATDPQTGGYWEVASDGGIFSFHAPFYGSMG